MSTAIAKQAIQLRVGVFTARNEKHHPTTSEDAMRYQGKYRTNEAIYLNIELRRQYLRNSILRPTLSYHKINYVQPAVGIFTVPPTCTVAAMHDRLAFSVSHH